MTTLYRRPAASAAALILALGASLGSLATSAQAAVTAQQVWDDWKSQFAMMGEGGVTVGSEAQAGDTLTVTDLAIASTGEDGTVVSGTLPEVTFTENGDGTVSVTTSESFPFTISTPADPATQQKATEVALALTHSGLDVTVSGDPGALTYDLTAARYAVELQSVTEDGAEVPAEGLAAFNGVSGSYTSTTGETRDVDYDLAATSMDLLIDATDAQDGTHLALSGKVNGIATEARVSMPLAGTSTPETMILDGLSLDGGYTTQGSQFIFEITDASGPTNGTVSTQGGTTNLQLSRENFGYDSQVKGLALQATSAQMPLPIDLTMAEFGANLSMPAARSDTPAPFEIGLNLGQLAINDEVWGMIDPGNLFGHEPATVRVALSGTARLFFDIFDPAQAEAMNAAAAPGELDSISLDDLEVALAGARVTGSGAFTIDNQDLATFGGMPKPVGTAEFHLSGVNKLIDSLVTMGLLPQEQVMGARMFMGLLTVPTGDDELDSKIEVTADGHILANGQRLQ